MPSNFPMPTAGSIRQIVADLLGRDVTVVAGDALQLERRTPAVAADYATETGRVGAVCVTDLRLSNALGAALTMVPASTVDEAVKQSIVNEQNLENLTEILNVLARLFVSDDCESLRWNAVHSLPGAMSDETAELLRAPLARRDFDVTLDEYGSGKLAFYLA